ncbi:hypothetical protein [Rhizohabitans arisaemae]|uniref:hypothetical protein n=1 Tax=Rhizohabitans arisaemae TaxID=2720610 RepID=UPI0024B17426|nr:hypothetical protein [Rhizohabitans arisaemae]
MVDRVVRRAAAVVAGTALALSVFAFAAPAASADFWMLSGPYPSDPECEQARYELVQSGGANVTQGCQWRSATQHYRAGWYFKFIAY